MRHILTLPLELDTQGMTSSQDMQSTNSMHSIQVLQSIKETKTVTERVEPPPPPSLVDKFCLHPQPAAPKGPVGSPSHRAYLQAKASTSTSTSTCTST
jgi:hypothetical protein